MSKKIEFFASSNSAIGFQSYFDLIYNSRKMEKIYIIKGGPGTGKSHLMKRVGKAFESINKTEYFLCSSDPKSLDGIIIDNKIAVIDGTAPHTVEAKYPGAVEVIVDTGKGIEKSLKNYRQEIFEISDKKSSLYKGAYSLLKSAGELKKEYSKMILQGCYYDKLEAAVSRFFKQNIRKGDGFTETIRLIEGITPNGIYKTGTFENIANKKCIIINSEGIDSLIYDCFLRKAKEYGLKTYISFDPLLPFSINGIYFPDSKLSVTNYFKAIHGEIDYDRYKVFNAERFINKENDTNNRSKLRFSLKCRNALIDEAIKYFSEASKAHMALESLYKENMNYEFVSNYSEEIIKEIETIY